MSELQSRFSGASEPPKNTNDHIRHYSTAPKESAIAEGVAIDCAQEILDNGPTTASQLCESVGGWALSPQVRGLAITHHYFEIRHWKRPSGAKSYRPVIGVTDVAREADEQDWPTELMDWDRDTSKTSW